MTLIPETGQALANSNSYCTIAEADSYHEAHLYGEVWNEASPAQKTRALLMATRVLDLQVEWKGQTVSDLQALQWPRWAVPRRGGRWFIQPNEIPVFLKEATAELARHLLIKDRTTDRSDRGVASVTAGDVSVTFDKNDTSSVLPDSVADMVSWYGRVQGGGVSFVRLRLA